MSNTNRGDRKEREWDPREHRMGPPIQVTADIIKEASRANSGHCMLADAIAKALPWASAVSVDLQTIRFSDRTKGVRYIYLTPDPLQRQLLRFDYGVVVEPFEIRLPSRPNQIVPIKKTDPARSTLAGHKVRSPQGPKRIPKGRALTVHGGTAPGMGVLAHSSSAGPGHRGLKRQFGVRLATEPFNPSV